MVKQAIKFLQAGHLDLVVQEQVLRAVRNLATDELLRDTFVSNAGVEALVRVCKPTTSEMLKEQAARALGNIAMSDANEERLVAAGGVELLVGFVCSSNEDLLNATLGALANLISNSEMRQRFVAAGGVQVLGHFAPFWHATSHTWHSMFSSSDQSCEATARYYTSRLAGLWHASRLTHC